MSQYLHPRIILFGLFCFLARALNFLNCTLVRSLLIFQAMVLKSRLACSLLLLVLVSGLEVELDMGDAITHAFSFSTFHSKGVHSVGACGVLRLRV